MRTEIQKKGRPIKSVTLIYLNILLCGIGLGDHKLLSTDTCEDNRMRLEA